MDGCAEVVAVYNFSIGARRLLQPFHPDQSCVVFSGVCQIPEGILWFYRPIGNCFDTAEPNTNTELRMVI